MASEKLLEAFIYLMAIFIAGDTAMTLHYWTYYGMSENVQGYLQGAAPLPQLLIKSGLFALMAQAAGRKLTDLERQRRLGIISWFEPWRIAQAVVVASFVLSWAYWASAQLNLDKAAKVQATGAHPGFIAISGLVVLSSFAWPALFRLMEPKSPFEPGSE